MPLPKIEADIRKFLWESSKRGRRTGRIQAQHSKRALELHIAGRYEEAIAEIERIPIADRSAEAWRVLGHAEHGRENFEAAAAAHLQSRRLHEDDRTAAAEDEENLAAVFASTKNYEQAWEHASRAANLAPGRLMTWIAKISILNCQARNEELRVLLRALLAEKPRVLADPVFRDHVKNDTDFIGVEKLVKNLEDSERS